MRRRAECCLALWILVLASADVPLHGQTAPFDQDSIVREMEALIDSTPDPDSKAFEAAQKLIQKGIRAHDARDYEKAVALYRKALAETPLSDLAYYELSFSYARMGEQEKSLDAVIRALTLNPKSEMYYVHKASILDDLGYREAALEAYRALLEIEPESYLGHLNLGITELRSSDYESAEKAFRRAIELQPDHPSGYFNLALLCNTLGYNYDERELLEKFVGLGQKDPRLERVTARLEELSNFEIQIDPDQPYATIELMEQMTRMAWATEIHKTTFPDARGYELTYEEDRAAYDGMLELWRDEKKDDPQAAHEPYDLLLKIDDAGFLDEYIWYHRQNVFGERGERWRAEHAERMEAMLAWAREEGLMGGETPAAKNSAMDNMLSFPTILMEFMVNSEITYQVSTDAVSPDGVLAQERRRYAQGLNLKGDDRVACARVVRNLSEAVVKFGSDALISVLRCHTPGDEGYEKGLLGASSLGLVPDEVEFAPEGGLIVGETVQLNGEAPWLAYLMAKSAWRKEPDLRERYGGSTEDPGVSLAEEHYALYVLAAAYTNARAPDDDPESPPIEPIAALDRLVETVESDHVRGYLLYEVIHKAYGIPLDRLDEDDAEEVSGYLFGHVLRHRKVGD